MKSREALIRLKRFQVDDKRLRVMQIKATIAEFDNMAAALDHEIEVEQKRTGVNDPTHVAYSTYAKAALARRDNLKRSAEELKAQLDGAQEALVEAFEDQKKVELRAERNQTCKRSHESGVPGEGSKPTAALFRSDRRPVAHLELPPGSL